MQRFLWRHPFVQALTFVNNLFLNTVTFTFWVILLCATLGREDKKLPICLPRARHSAHVQAYFQPFDMRMRSRNQH